MKMKRTLQNVLVATVSVLFSVAAAEFAVRVIKPVYDYRDRSLLFSSHAFKQYSGGSIRYFPNRKIREVAVYNNRIEYDVLYETNNLGFIDSKNYGYGPATAKKYYAFIGDSFTAGVNGGSPWVPKLRTLKDGVEVYSFGVAATGFDHFYLLLHEMKDKVRITDIVIVAITDDFYRGYWHPLEADGKISFCSFGGEHRQCQPIPVAGVIPLNASAAEVLEISRNTYKDIRARVDEINSANGLMAKTESLLYDDSALYYYTRQLIDTYRRSHKPDNIENALASIEKIRAEYPGAVIHLVHLPQKYEVATGNYQLNIARQLQESNVKYFPALEKCRWSTNMFFPHDAHPNRDGYENITKCVAAYLFGTETLSDPNTTMQRK
jgi:hypothetical protein